MTPFEINCHVDESNGALLCFIPFNVDMDCLEHNLNYAHFYSNNARPITDIADYYSPSYHAAPL